MNSLMSWLLGGTVHDLISSQYSTHFNCQYPTYTDRIRGVFKNVLAQV